MVGTGSAKPTCQIKFEDNGESTTVVLHYNFHRIQSSTLCCGPWLSKEFPQSVSSVLAETMRKVTTEPGCGATAATMRDPMLEEPSLSLAVTIRTLCRFTVVDG